MGLVEFSVVLFGRYTWLQAQECGYQAIPGLNVEAFQTASISTKDHVVGSTSGRQSNLPHPVLAIREAGLGNSQRSGNQELDRSRSWLKIKVPSCHFYPFMTIPARPNLTLFLKEPSRSGHVQSAWTLCWLNWAAVVPPPRQFSLRRPVALCAQVQEVGRCERNRAYASCRRV